MGINSFTGDSSNNYDQEMNNINYVEDEVFNDINYVEDEVFDDINYDQEINNIVIKIQNSDPYDSAIFSKELVAKLKNIH